MQIFVNRERNLHVHIQSEVKSFVPSLTDTMRETILTGMLE